MPKSQDLHVEEIAARSPCQTTENDARAAITAMTEHLPSLRRYAASLTRNRSLADDLVQDTLVRAIQKVEQYQLGTNLRAWLFVILHNVFIDSTRRMRSQDIDSVANVGMTAAYSTPAQMPNLEMRDLQMALDRLQPAQRSTLMLASVEGMRYDAIAQVTGVPVGTVRSRLSRARAAVTATMAGNYRNEGLTISSEKRNGLDSLSHGHLPSRMKKPQAGGHLKLSLGGLDASRDKAMIQRSRYRDNPFSEHRQLSE